MKKQTLDNKLRKNPYIVSTFVLGLFVVILLTGSIFESRNEILTENKILCSAIYQIPAWASEGKVIQYGVLSPENISIDIVNEVLIKGRIKFLYNPDCSACQKQIEFFIEQGTWEAYQKSKLTVDCSEVLK